MKFTIYYFSDTHGSIFESRSLLNFKELIKKDNNSIVIDGGDTLQGTPFLSYLNKFNKVEYLSNIFNDIKLDYYIPGNHDFNFGIDYLKTYINNLNAKTLCANIAGISKIIPYDTFEIDGKKITIFGITNDFFAKYENKENLKNVLIESEFEVTKRHFEHIRSISDYVVGVYHGGFEKDPISEVTENHFSQNKTFQILEHFPFDIFLTGHQHLIVDSKKIENTYTFQPGSFARGVFKISIDLDTKNIDSEFLEAKAYNGQVDDLIADYFNWMDKPLTKVDTISTESTHLGIAVNNPAIPNLINQVLLDTQSADISICSFGNFAPQLESNVIKIKDIYKILPFPNNYSKISISGAELKKALDKVAMYFRRDKLEIIVSRDFINPKPRHHFLDFFYNVKFEITTKKRSSKVSNIRINNVPIKNNQTYTVLVSDFRLAGAHGYTLFENYDLIERYDFNIQDLLIEQLEKYDEFKIDKEHYMEIK